MTTEYLRQVLQPITNEITLLDGPNKPVNYFTNYRDYTAVKAGIVNVFLSNASQIATLIDTLPEGELANVQNQEDLPVYRLNRGTFEKYKSYEYGGAHLLEHHEIQTFMGELVKNGVILQKVSPEQCKITLIASKLLNLKFRMLHTLGKFIYGALTGEINTNRLITAGEEAVKIKLPVSALTGIVTTSWLNPAATIISDMSAIADILSSSTRGIKIEDCKVVMSSKIFRAITSNTQVQKQITSLNILSTPLDRLPNDVVINNPTLRQYFGQIVVSDDIYYQTYNASGTKFLDENKIYIMPPDVRNDIYIAPTSLDPHYQQNESETGASYLITDGLGDLQDRNVPANRVPSTVIGLRAKMIPIKDKESYTGEVIF